MPSIQLTPVAREAGQGRWGFERQRHLTLFSQRQVKIVQFLQQRQRVELQEA